MKHEVKVIPKEEILANRSNAYEFINIETMKNVHILPTEHTSRLYYNSQERTYQLCEFPKYHTDIKSTHNLYITSDEEIKEGDWVIDDEQDVFQVLEVNNLQGILRSDGFTYVVDVCKKIILTTDQDLDGVQAIDDEFLEWFVKNPSCEKVLVTNLYDDFNPIEYFYESIIPQEEPKQYTSEELEGFEDFKKMIKLKQETLEEAAENHINNDLDLYESLVDGHISYDIGMDLLHKLFIEGAKLQQERRYSEEDLRNAFFNGWIYRGDEKYRLKFPEAKKDWFEKFKKK